MVSMPMVMNVSFLPLLSFGAQSDYTASLTPTLCRASSFASSCVTSAAEMLRFVEGAAPPICFFGVRWGLFVLPSRSCCRGPLLLALALSIGGRFAALP